MFHRIIFSVIVALKNPVVVFQGKGIQGSKLIRHTDGGGVCVISIPALTVFGIRIVISCSGIFGVEECVIDVETGVASGLFPYLQVGGMTQGIGIRIIPIPGIGGVVI